MPLTSDQLRDINLELLSRPAHEKVRSLVYRLLVDGLGAASTDIDFETTLKEVHGRTDALLGRTVFEFKSDLRKELRDAKAKLPDYLSHREADTGEHFVGIATDGANFLTYELRDGVLRELPSFTPNAEHPRDLLVWLSSVVAISADLPPEPDVVRRELGRGSHAWHIGRADLAALWTEVSGHPEVRLKRELWAGLLERVYGSPVDDDDLFFQHTYLTIVAKTMAVHVLGLDMPHPADLLAGRPFAEIGINGVVESDFFDWPLSAARGADLVGRIAAQAARFRLRDIEADVLKSLYESLIDPEQRHDLGEYYTPDWLATKMCEQAIERPLEQRVLDPACGSGSFLFHAVRHLLAAADAAGMSNEAALTLCCANVRGIDVHPVAVQIARVTYLLALGQTRLRDHPPLAIPVYIGDSLQWNTTGFLTARELEIEVPEQDDTLDFPFSVAQDPALFDSVITRMLDLSEGDAPRYALEAWLKSEHGMDDTDVRKLSATYEHLRHLQRTGRNHIWGFVARNLVRPAWLSRDDERSDIVIGNPPWLSYRYMSRETQAAFKKACEERGIWAGGKVATHQDLSAYFFARCVELYFKPDGLIAFVMPYATMSRRQFEGFRKGIFGRHRARGAERINFVKFTTAWAFPDVQPLFPVPSCVLFARRRGADDRSPVLPASVLQADGALRRRDATPAEAAEDLTWNERPWPAVAEAAAGSPYRDAFRQGATMVPRMLCVVEPIRTGPLGGNLAAPLVQSRRTTQEKAPWKTLPPLRGNVESRFLRPLYLGESIAPFRLLYSVAAVIPWEPRWGLLDAASAQARGHLHLARWLSEGERLWQGHGRGGLTLIDRWDFHHELVSQFPPAPLRVVYTASGTIPAVAVLRDAEAICEHGLYWVSVASEAEAAYLAAVLNSEAARARVAGRQARGQWGARHFDKVMFELPIPKFDPADRLHKRLSAASARAEAVASAVVLHEGEHFIRSRGRIRTALAEDGVAAEIDRLVEELL